jgi:hypothetical protein
MHRLLIVTSLIAASAALADDKPADKPAAPKRLAVGTAGLFQPGLLLQGWFLYEQTDVPTSTFRIRRTEVSVSGELLPGRVSYRLMLDPSRVLEARDTTVPVQNADTAGEQVVVKQPVGAASVLQDVLITYLSPYAEVSIGQFKVPISWEGYNSSARLVFPERALVSREFGDRRDLGVRVAKTFEPWSYSAGVFNGAGQNNLDVNNQKDAALRLEAYPLEGLTLAGAVLMSVGQRLAAGTKDRFELDGRFERGPLLLQAELIRARDVGSAGAVDAHGFYALAAYLLTDTLQAALRVGYLDQDLARDLDPVANGNRDEAWHFDAGLNYFLQKHEAKLQLSYSRVQYDVRTPLNQVILAAQVAF